MMNLAARTAQNQLRNYQQERGKSRWLPELRVLALFEYQLRISIDGVCEDLLVDIKLSDRYPFRAPIIRLTHTPPQLRDCCHDNIFWGFEDRWTPAMTLLGQIITLYSYISSNTALAATHV